MEGGNQRKDKGVMEEETNDGMKNGMRNGRWHERIMEGRNEVGREGWREGLLEVEWGEEGLMSVK